MNLLGACLAAGIVAALVSALSTPPVRLLARRLNLLDHPGGRSDKWHASATPYLGGVSIVLGLAIALVIVRPQDQAGGEIAAILAAALLCGLIGGLDDWRSLGILARLIPMLICGAVMWFVGVGAYFTGFAPLDLLVTALWLAAVTNAFNFIDNTDGVATGVAALAGLSYVFIAIATGEQTYAVTSAAVVGACVGFLPFNFRPATIFMGDLGSMFLGFLLGAVGLGIDLPAKSTPTRILTALLIMGVPLFNLLLLIVSRVRASRPLTQGASDGVVHRLTRIGLSRTEAASVFWLATAALGATGISIATLHMSAALLTFAVCLALTLIAIWLFEKVHVETSIPNSKSMRKI